PTHQQLPKATRRGHLSHSYYPRYPNYSCYCYYSRCHHSFPSVSVHSLFSAPGASLGAFPSALLTQFARPTVPRDNHPADGFSDSFSYFSRRSGACAKGRTRKPRRREARIWRRSPPWGPTNKALKYTRPAVKIMAGEVATS